MLSSGDPASGHGLCLALVLTQMDSLTGQATVFKPDWPENLPGEGCPVDISMCFLAFIYMFS